MSQSMVNFRMDFELKKAMETACKKMGMSMSTAFTIFATKVTQEQKIPFEITTDPFYAKENIEYLTEIIRKHESGESIAKEHDLIEV